MHLFRRHKTVTTFLFMYALWWIFIFLIPLMRRKAQPSCDFTGPAIFFSTIFIAGVLTLGLAIRYLTSKSGSKKDYLIFMAIVVLPVLLVYLTFILAN